MRKKTIVALIIGTVLVVGSVSMAYAKDWHNDGRMGQQVQLSPEQQTQFNELYKAHETTMTPLYKEFQMKRAEYDAFMKNTNPDPSQASKLAGELADIQTKIKNQAMQFRDSLQKANLPVHHGADFNMGHGNMRQGMMGSMDCGGLSGPKGGRHF